jgi:hypothetical protein
MSDTEADARRLLIAATSDMPDGIDLLDGFARTRSRTRRRRRRAVVSTGVVVAVAAATATALAVGVAPAARTVAPARSAHAAGPARSALTAVTTALNNTVHMQSYRETSDPSVYYANLDGKSTSPSRHFCIGEEDAAAGLATYSCSGPGAEFTELEAGGWIYNYYPTASSGYDYKHWVRIKASEVMSPPATSPVSSASNDLPQQILSAIEAGGVKVSTVGPASGPGWTGTKYTFTWTGKPRDVGHGIYTKPDVITGTIVVDQQGRTRVLEYNDRSTAVDGTVLVMTTDETFSDFGLKVTVPVPPANQVYTQNPYYRGNRTGPSR